MHNYAPAHQTQIYFGTIVHQVLDRCHSHYHGVLDPITRGTLPDGGNLLTNDEILDYFDEQRDARRNRAAAPPAPSDILRYFVEVENGLISRGIRAITPDLRVKAVRILQYFNRLEGPTLYPRVVDTEHRLQADQQSHILHGVIDLLLSGSQDNKNPAEYEIWDYKGTERIHLTPRDLETYRFQMRVYAHLYQLKHGVFPRRTVLYFLNELDGPTCPTTRPVNALLTVDLEQDEVDVAMNEFGVTVNDIERARTNNLWSPAPVGVISEQDCAICDLRWDCPTPNGGRGVALRHP